MMTKKYGVVSTGILSADKSFRDFRRGAIVEFGPEEQKLFVEQAPQNFIELVEGFVWNAEVAADFHPGMKYFVLMFDVEAQKNHQHEFLKMKEAGRLKAEEAGGLKAEEAGRLKAEEAGRLAQLKKGK